jgi:hypothetical protein
LRVFICLGCAPGNVRGSEGESCGISPVRKSG